MLMSRWQHARTIILVLLLALQLSPVLMASAQEAGTPDPEIVTTEVAAESTEVSEPGNSVTPETVETPEVLDPTPEAAQETPVSGMVPAASNESEFQVAGVPSYNPPGPNPGVTFSDLSAQVGDEITFSVVDFPPNALLQVVHGNADGGPVEITSGPVTDANGAGNGSFIVPPMYGQTFQEIRIAVGFESSPENGWSEFFSWLPGDFYVESKLAFTPPVGVVLPGAVLQMELTGGPMVAGPRDVRLSTAESFTFIGQINIGLNGSVTFLVQIPEDRANGIHTISVVNTSVEIMIFKTVAPKVTLSTERTTVNSNVSFTLVGFAKDRPLTVTWTRPGGSSLLVFSTQTSKYGEASGTFKVPATEGGSGNRITFTASSVTRTVEFDVAPRIKLIPAEGVRGGTVEVSLRGFTKNETVRIRWKIGSSFVLITTVTMSNTGSANFNVTIPANAAFGVNSVRADGTVWRQQTNAFVVTG